jgi:hypothetical protein
MHSLEKWVRKNFIAWLIRSCLPRNRGTWWHSGLRHCAASCKVAGSIPDGVIGIFHQYNFSGSTMTLQSTQYPTEMNTRNISRGKGGRCLGLTTYLLQVPINLQIWKPQLSGNILLHSYVNMHCIAVLSWSFCWFVLPYVYCKSRIYVTQVKGVILRILYTNACCEMRAAWGTNLNTWGGQQSRDPSVDSE